MKGTGLNLDTSVPALLVKVGYFPHHHGALAAVRSLGRVGVPTYAVTEDRFTPIAVSRYLTGRFRWPFGSSVPAETHIARLLEIGAEIGRPTIAIASDDAAALLLAEHAEALRPHFLLPQVAPDLPRRLADKRGMYELCRAHGVPTPRTLFPTTLDELVSAARDLGYPVIAKSIEPWTPRPLVASTVVIQNEADLLDRLGHTSDVTGLMVQEFIPHDRSEDWFVALHSDAAADSVVRFVGTKVRAWPPRRGVTADGRAAPHPDLAEITAAFIKGMGFQGIASLDWRLDLRDGRFLLVDFNVRPGAQFRVGVTENDIDVIRAAHLELTGRPVPAAAQDYQRRLLVGNLYLPAIVGGRVSRLPVPERPARGVRTERAWLAGDDMMPALAMLVRGARPVAAAFYDIWRDARRPR